MSRDYMLGCFKDRYQDSVKDQNRYGNVQEVVDAVRKREFHQNGMPLCTHRTRGFYVFWEEYVKEYPDMFGLEEFNFKYALYRALVSAQLIELDGKGRCHYNNDPYKKGSSDQPRDIKDFANYWVVQILAKRILYQQFREAFNQTRTLEGWLWYLDFDYPKFGFPNDPKLRDEVKKIFKEQQLLTEPDKDEDE